MNVTASTSRNGTNMQKYWPYTGVGTWLAANRQIAIMEASGRAWRARTHETQAAKQGSASKTNCRVVAVAVPDRPNSARAGRVF